MMIISIWEEVMREKMAYNIHFLELEIRC